MSLLTDEQSTSVYDFIHIDNTRNALCSLFAVTHRQFAICVSTLHSINLTTIYMQSTLPFFCKIPWMYLCGINWAAKLSAITQTLLYVTLLATPIADVVAWLTKKEQLGDLLGLVANVLLGLLALHVAGTLSKLTICAMGLMWARETKMGRVANKLVTFV